MAQLGRALRSGRRGRRFESCRIDSWQGRRKLSLCEVSGLFLFHEEYSQDYFIMLKLKKENGKRGIYMNRIDYNIRTEDGDILMEKNSKRITDKFVNLVACLYREEKQEIIENMD